MSYSRESGSSLLRTTGAQMGVGLREVDKDTESACDCVCDVKCVDMREPNGRARVPGTSARLIDS